MLPRTWNPTQTRPGALTSFVRRPWKIVALCLAGWLVAAAGCSRPPQPIAPRRYARVNSLLSLHPAWVQVTSLDRELARIRTAPQQAGTLTYTPIAAPANFVPKTILPTNLAAERARQVDRDARRYVESLQKSQDAINRTILGQERRREQKRVERELAAQLVDAEQKLRDINEVKVFANHQLIRTLTFQEAVVLSRIRNYSQGNLLDTRPLKEAQAEHTRIVAEIDRLNAENRDLLAADVVAQVARNRDAYRLPLEKASQARLMQREEALNADKQEKVAAAMRQQKDTAIPAPSNPPLPPPGRSSTPLPLPPDSASGAVLANAQFQVNTALDRQRAIWQAQRANLVADIRADTEKALQQAAMQRGWTLVREGDPLALDATAEFADMLRAQWREGKPK